MKSQSVSQSVYPGPTPTTDQRAPQLQTHTRTQIRTHTQRAHGSPPTGLPPRHPRQHMLYTFLTQ